MGTYFYYAGAYPEVLKDIRLSEAQKGTDYLINIGEESYKTTLHSDITERGAFISDERYSSEQISKRCIDTTHLGPTGLYCYTQGDFTGSLFTVLRHPQLRVFLVLSNLPSSDKLNENDFSVLYVDDDNKLCGFSIYCYQDNSNENIPEKDRPWNFSCAIIHDCNAVPQERSVFYITHPDILPLSKPTQKTETTVGRDFKEHTKQVDVFPIISHVEKTKHSGTCDETDLLAIIQAQTKSKRLNALIATIFNSQRSPYEVITDLDSRIINHDFDNQSEKREQLNRLIQVKTTVYGNNPNIIAHLNSIQKAMNDDVNFFQGDNCIQRVTTDIEEYIELRQRKELLEYTNNNPPYQKNLRAYGQNILKQVDILEKDQRIAKSELIKALKATYNTITNPTQDNITECLNVAKGLPEHRIAHQKLRGLLIGLAGAALILTSVAAAVVTFGAVSPVSLGFMVLGASMIGFGASIFGAGAGAYLVTKGIFSFKGTKNPLTKTMIQFAKKTVPNNQESPKEDSQDPSMPDPSF